MGLRGALAPVCEPVWVLSDAFELSEDWLRLLRRLGEVVDVRGLALDEAAGRVAASGVAGITGFVDSMLGVPAWVLSAGLGRGVERLSDRVDGRKGPALWEVVEELEVETVPEGEHGRHGSIRGEASDKVAPGSGASLGQHASGPIGRPFPRS